MYIYIKKYEINYILDKNRFVLLLENFLNYLLYVLMYVKRLIFNFI